MSRGRDIAVSHILLVQFENMNELMSVFQGNLIFKMNNNNFISDAHSNHAWKVENNIRVICTSVNINFKTAIFDVSM